MSAVFNLDDLESGNLVGSYGAEDEARDIARAAWRRSGDGGLDGLVLLRVDDDGTHSLVAEGDALVAPTEDAAQPDRASLSTA